MTTAEQLDRLIDAGLPDVAGVTADVLVAHAARLPDEPGTVLAVHPSLAAPRRLATLLRHEGKPGFVVTDMPDLDEFVPIKEVHLPDAPLYLLHEPARGDDMSNWSPDEALPAILGLGRSPMTVNEGISWLLQDPKVLERNHCFMTIGSRKPKGQGARCPDAGDLAQQRDRSRRRLPQERTQGRLVLGRQPPHVAGVRLHQPPHRVTVP